MDAQTIVNIQDFKQTIADDLNKYLDKVPAVVISDFLAKLSAQFNDLAMQQYKEAMKIITESEVEKNGGQKSNRTDSQ